MQDISATLQRKHRVQQATTAMQGPHPAWSVLVGSLAMVLGILWSVLQEPTLEMEAASALHVKKVSTVPSMVQLSTSNVPVGTLHQEQTHNLAQIVVQDISATLQPKHHVQQVTTAMQGPRPAWSVLEDSPAMVLGILWSVFQEPTLEVEAASALHVKKVSTVPSMVRLSKMHPMSQWELCIRNKLTILLRL